MKQIAHLTSVHARFDTRIFVKQCQSLARAGYSVSLIVADGKGNEQREGVHILDAGASRGRLDRMLGATRRVLAKAVELDADIYHIHDPELLFAGLALKRHGKIVIFDAHEDLPLQIMSKHYLPRWIRGGVASVAGRVLYGTCRRLDAVVAATPGIKDAFGARTIPAVTVKNYPALQEWKPADAVTRREKAVCYVGGIGGTRGIHELVQSMGLASSGASLILAGKFSEPDLRTRVMALPGWGKVEEVGFVDRAGVKSVLDRSVAGLVTLHPTPAYVDSLPVKMFEYMSAGLPVIASDFPLWREIIEKADCGLCVDPLDPAAIAAAIDRLVEDPALAQRMGDNGRRAVETEFNWGVEEQKLLDLYRTLLSRG